MEINKPSISIALASYNGERYIAEQLQSIANQSLTPHELVISDDNSSDATIEICYEFSKQVDFDVRIFRNESNVGCTRNFEIALAECKGEYIFICDQDDFWDPRKIEAVVDVLLSNQDVHVIVNDAWYTDANLVCTGGTILQKIASVRQPSSGHIAGACTAISRQFRDVVLPFPRVECPEYDVLIHRCAGLLVKKYVLPEPLQYWRIHGVNSTSDNEMSEVNHLSGLRQLKNALHKDPREEYRKKAREYTALKKILVEREPLVLRNIGISSLNDALQMADDIAAAHVRRANLHELDAMARITAIVGMLVRGDYSYFRGWRSVIRDLMI